MEINPYQSPQAECAAVEVIDEPLAVRRMRLAIRLYRWMGYGGGLFCGIAVIAGACDLWLEWTDLPLVDLLAGGAYTLLLALFVESIYVGSRLATRPLGMLRRARLVGFAIGTVWFPLSTIPAVICVRNVTRYLDAYCRWM